MGDHNEFTHYRSNIEYFNDQLIILDLLIEEIIQQIKKQAMLSSVTVTNKLTLTDEEALSVLRSKLTYLQLSTPYLQLIERLEGAIASKLEQTSMPVVTTLSIIKLQQIFQLDELDKRVLMVLLAPHVNKKYLRLYGYIQDDMTKQYATLELLIKLCARSDDDIQRLYERYSRLKHHYSLLYSIVQDQQVLFSDSSVLVRLIHPNEILVSFLFTQESYSSSLFQSWSLEQLLETNEPLILQSSLTDQMVSYINDKALVQPIFQFIGAKGSGKTLQMKHLAQKLNSSYIEVTEAQLVDDHGGMTTQAKQVVLAAKLTNSIIGIERDEKRQDKDYHYFYDTLLANFDGVICIHSLNRATLKLTENRSAVSISIDTPSKSESIMLWQTFSSDVCELTVEELNHLANKFVFTCGQIKQTMAYAKQKLLWRSISDQNKQVNATLKQIIESAYAVIHHDLHKKSIKLDTTWEWEDLILPEETIDLLQQACNRIERKQTVLDEWGFSRILPYGRGISMLFTGPPGTGKSMSASVMAKQMKSELYRVDLSMIVSKYIGETEKNLAEIFDQAKQSGAILFFDEADSLFGKRSEVKDAHDKYANMETAFLLQKMEEYEGLTILATNFAQNLDEAFNRRIQYIIKFPFPDVQQRERLWRSVIPPQLPVEGIDYQFLAKTFELTGGPIKNIVLSAAYLAATNQERVTMRHMIEAAIQEYKKSGKLLMKERLGEYGQLWKG